ncbi:hypothetical protein J2S43_001658 [Catenuloplanes nepalensis]|uniref:CHAT domain-containing protein n=1 Tax=Catenuloplanes nepalensis TaxID=587533 RepID=A0ABT9MPZ0_9ACTN|nr:hypothetical protein [Catenuloplanes nepalensis]MDP9793146.1 hypothetical protein [Catenuloplanes nepalensis]
MPHDITGALRAELDGTAGPERTRPLLQLGQHLFSEYWRAGPGLEAALPHLDQSIEAVSEACRYLEPGDAQRGSATAMLGVGLAMRRLAHGGTENDRETGIAMLEESSGSGMLPPAMRLMARMALGQLYLLRAVQGSPAGAAGDADRAVTCFREVRAEDDEVLRPEMREAAATLLDLAEAMQVMRGGLGGGPAGLDLGRMMRAMSTLQKLQERMRTGGPAVPAFFDAESLARLDPLDRPLTFVEMDPHEPAPDAPAPPLPVPGVPAPDLPAPSVRPETHALVIELTGAEDVHAAAGILLGPEPPPITAADVDDLVGLAATVVHTGEHAGPVDRGTDLLLLAAALHTRARRDRLTPGDPDGDHRVAARHLAEALETLPPDHPATASAVRRLGAFLDGDPPLGGLAGRFAAVLARIGATDPVAALLHSVCRAVAGHGEVVLTAQIPRDLPWAARIRAIVEAAVRHRSALGGAAPADVAEALRAMTVDGLAGPDRLFLDAADGRISPAWPPGWRRVMIVEGTPGISRTGAVVSYVAGIDQILKLAGRDAPAPGRSPVFVANPRGDRESAGVDAVMIRRFFHPRSIGLGRTVEHVDGAGTPGEVAAHLDASLLQLACGVTAGGLELAGPATLGIEAIRAHAGRAGGLAILPSCAGEASGLLAGALVDGGFAGVVGWLRPVPAPVESLSLFMLHLKLVDEGLPAADAVHELRRWLAAPARIVPEHLPAGYSATLRDPRLAEIVTAGSLRYWGR